MNSCFRHLQAWGLHLQEIRNFNYSNEQTEVWTRWLQTVRDLKSFSRISLEKVSKGVRWVSNTEIIFKRLWTLLVDVVLSVFLLVLNVSVYLSAEILVIYPLTSPLKSRSIMGFRKLALKMSLISKLWIYERLSSWWSTINLSKSSPFINSLMNLSDFLNGFPNQKHGRECCERGDGEIEVWHRLCALQHGHAEVERRGILASNGVVGRFEGEQHTPRNSRSLKSWEKLTSCVVQCFYVDVLRG